MSKHMSGDRITVPQIRAMKGKQKIVCLTAYTSPIARLLDPHCDLLLVGDSVGMVLHGQAVLRGSTDAAIVVDLPFGSYERNAEQAFKTASKVLRKTGCQAVKVEASAGAADSIAFLASRGIPVMGHVGLRPQAANVEGGFKVKGRKQCEFDQVMEDARAIDEAGAFAILIEGVTEELASKVTASVKAPTIGIGASPACDGQILVTDDMVGMFDWTPKFVRRYASLRTQFSEAAAYYSADVLSGSFPGESEVYHLPIGQSPE